MKLYRNGINLEEGLVKFISSSNAILIFSPFIKLITLRHLIEASNNIKSVFVRWEPKDIILGSSDLEIYDFLKSKNITLFRTKRLHMKAYVDDYLRCFITSANISSRALNLPVITNYNYEIGTIVDELSVDDQLYFKMIENDSLLITDSIYNQIKEQVNNITIDTFDDYDFNLIIEKPEKDFLISALPMSYSVEKFFDVYFSYDKSINLDMKCLIHDLATYKLPLGLPKTDLLEQLKISFFAHPFIDSFLNILKAEGEVYFGRAKEWVHKNCADVPLPRKWEITENIQILYRWIVELGDGKYAVDRPNYSERLFVK
jgi:hypothetical protein